MLKKIKTNILCIKRDASENKNTTHYLKTKSKVEKNAKNQKQQNNKKKLKKKI